MRNHVSKQQQQIPLGEEEGSLNTTELTVAISMDEDDEPSISPHHKMERHVIALTNDDDENDNDDFSSSYSSEDNDNEKEEEVWSRQLKAKLLEAQTLTKRLKQVEYNLKQKEQALLKSSENSHILQLQGLLAATQREKEWLEEQHSQTRQNHQRQLQSLAEQFAALQQQRRGERGEQQSTSSRRHSGLTTSLSSGDRHRRRHDTNRDDGRLHQPSISSQQQHKQQSEQSQQQPRSFKYIFDEPYDGRLGLILQADDNVVSHKRRVGRGGGPVVHGIRESSPLAGLVQVGDKIVEVDGKDTTKCGLSEIVHLLSCRRSDSSGRIMFERYYAESMRLGVGSGNDGYGHDDNSI